MTMQIISLQQQTQQLTEKQMVDILADMLGMFNPVHCCSSDILKRVSVKSNNAKITIKEKEKAFYGLFGTDMLKDRIERYGKEHYSCNCEANVLLSDDGFIVVKITI